MRARRYLAGPLFAMKAEIDRHGQDDMARRPGRDDDAGEADYATVRGTPAKGITQLFERMVGVTGAPTIPTSH